MYQPNHKHNKAHFNLLKVNYKLAFLIILLFLNMLWIKNLYESYYFESDQNHILQLEIISKDKKIYELQTKIKKISEDKTPKPVEKKIKKPVEKKIQIPIIVDTVKLQNLKDTL